VTHKLAVNYYPTGIGQCFIFYDPSPVNYHPSQGAKPAVFASRCLESDLTDYGSMVFIYIRQLRQGSVETNSLKRVMNVGHIKGALTMQADKQLRKNQEAK